MSIEPRVGSLPTPDGRLGYHVLDAPGAVRGHTLWLQEINPHLDLCWTDPTIKREIGGLPEDGLTTVVMQSRGLALSDPMNRRATVEEQAADVIAVMDAEGIPSATLVGIASTGLAVALAAAQNPDRVTGLVLIGCALTGPAVAEDEYGWTPDAARRCIDGYRAATEAWGSGETLRLWDTELCTPLNVRLLAMLERCSAAPALATEYMHHLVSYDGRAIYPQVRVPTRVLHPAHHSFPLATKQALVDVVDGAQLVSLPPSVLGDGLGDAWKHMARQVAEVALGGQTRFGSSRRVLATVLFTDIVDSTRHLDQPRRLGLGRAAGPSRRDGPSRGPQGGRTSRRHDR